MKITHILHAIGFTVLAAQASASSLSDFESDSYAVITPNDPSVKVSDTGAGGPYQDFSPSATGDGTNYLNTTLNYLDDTTYVMYSSAASSAEIHGSASNFQGIDYSFNITNTSSTNEESFSLFEEGDLFVTLQGSKPFGQTNAYGGWEINSYESSGYAQLTQYATNDFGIQSTSDFSTSYNYNSGFEADIHFSANDTFWLAPGASDSLKVWASGSTYANTPAPGAALAFLGGMMAKRRRKRV